MILCALAWSGEVWGETWPTPPGGYTRVYDYSHQKKTWDKSGDNLKNCVSDGKIKGSENQMSFDDRDPIHQRHV